jgi:UDP-N-acetyl-D-mannosaminuronic acid dehydrogenase
MLNVIGLGYIGLPTALAFAANGVKVIGTDYNTEHIIQLQKGNVTFREQGLQDLYAKARENIAFSTNYQKAEYYLIAVPTPYEPITHHLDMKFVIEACRDALSVCFKGSIIIIESTVAPGAIDKYIKPLAQEYGFLADVDIFFAHAPERIIPGNMIYELKHNSRIIGCDHPETGKKVENLYAVICDNDIFLTSVKAAEMVKVVENSYRDMNIAFANELAKICHSAKLDVHEIIDLANHHPRVNILKPGPGVGGHCLAVDPWFLISDYPKESLLIHQARLVNEDMPRYIWNRIKEICEEKRLNIEKVGIYGVTYKENVDDIRESPSLQLMRVIDTKKIHVYDPLVKLSEQTIDQNSSSDLQVIQYDNFDRFLSCIELCVIMVGHHHIVEHQNQLQGKVIYDTKHILNKAIYI